MPTIEDTSSNNAGALTYFAEVACMRERLRALEEEARNAEARFRALEEAARPFVKYWHPASSDITRKERAKLAEVLGTTETKGE